MWRLAISDFSILASGSKMTSTCGKESSDFWRIIFGVVQPYCPIFPLENFKTSQHLLSSYVQERSPWILDGIGGMCCIKTNSTRMLSWYLLSQIRPHEMRCSYFLRQFCCSFSGSSLALHRMDSSIFQLRTIVQQEGVLSLCSDRCYISSNGCFFPSQSLSIAMLILDMVALASKDWHKKKNPLLKY